jgi:hypothetical protein
MLSPSTFKGDFCAKGVSLLFSESGRAKLEELRSSGADTQAIFSGGMA